jgi:hypothetical protein
MKKIHKVILVFVLISGVLAFLPYCAWLENRLETLLEDKGFKNVELTIASLGLKSASVENVTIGAEETLRLENIVLDYSLLDLWHGNLRNLSLSGIVIDVKQTDGRWVVSGLEGWGATPQDAVPSESFSIPSTAQQLMQIPFEQMTLEKSALNFIFESGNLSIPLEATWRKRPQPELHYNAKNPAFNLGDLSMTGGNLSLDAYIEETQKNWAGTWELQDIEIQGTSVPVPVLNGKGTLLAGQENINVNGTISSNDQLWHTDFNMNYNFNRSEESNLKIVQAHMPWKSGRLSVQNVDIDLEDEAPIKVTLQLENVSLQELMQSLTGDRVSATGQVSGKLPLIIGRDGKLTVLPGNFKSNGQGTVSMPPDVIPGDNEQVALVRQILGGLQYTDLSISVKNDQDGRLGVLLTFEGNNPDVYDGKPVKLNVNLTGDVLEFIEQNMMLLNNPEQLLEQGKQ